MPADGSPVEQLRGHLRALAGLMKRDRQLWAVMGELVLRAPRDADLERIVRQTDGFWHRTLRDLISRCIDNGSIDPVLNADDMATLIIVVLKGVSLPTVAGFRPELVDRVMQMLEQLLDLPTQERN
jgi:hypothetical protein